MATGAENNIRLPIYVQISELLTREINAGVWPVGSRLPTEADLARNLNCAVGTLRKALAELENRGVVERIQGSGTYVRKADVMSGVYAFFHLELNEGVGLPSAIVLDLSKQPLPQEAPTFGSGTSERGHRIRRLRMLGEQPAALEEIWFDVRHVKKLSASEISESVHQFYKNRLDFWIANVEDRVSVGRFPDWVSEGSPFEAGKDCGLVTRISWSNHGAVEEFSRTWFDTRHVHYNARWR